ncbi:SDR family NAD(P)-dependent oxidoreductase [Hamadaea tsunoensis]|uniref:SDR family NAD(P)-dependent oxidoreductase n=1 Tax=Hamadaea tsunoensis TaxID=53368 RepID=UPI00041A1204|nr:SDR family oxidoreductase [Hamadaea tsunoensis]
MGELDGLVAVITGGGSGIGAAAAQAFVAAGARVGILDVHPGEYAAPASLPLTADITDGASVEAAMRTAAETFGGIDILVNNAGISSVGTVEDNDDAEWLRVLDVNVVGFVRATRAALPYLRRSAHAAIVNTSSIAAGAGLPKRALYSASKGAVHSLTLALAADLVGEGIRVNCVAPGTADTPWVARLLARTEDPAGEKARLEARQPMGRLVSADEVAAAMLYLASPRNGATTGISLAVDGGMHGLRLPR